LEMEEQNETLLDKESARALCRQGCAYYMIIGG
jgi:hypothetical protein